MYQHSTGRRAPRQSWRRHAASRGALLRLITQPPPSPPASLPPATPNRRSSSAGTRSSCFCRCSDQNGHFLNERQGDEAGADGVGRRR
jgi:hypothetical protein